MPPIERRWYSALGRVLRRPDTLAIALIVTALVVAAALAAQAVRASAAHRAAVEITLEHNATTAAWHFARGARSWLEYGMGRAGNAIQNEAARAASLPGPDLLQRVLHEKYCDCMTAGFATTFMRVASRDGPLDVIGEPLGERARDDLRDSLRALLADTLVLPGRDDWRMLPAGAPRLNRGTDIVLLWVVRNATHRARAVYAMIVDRAQIERPMIGALDAARFFEEQLVSPRAADSLVRIEVRGANGAVFFASGPETEQFAGSDTLGRALGNLVVIAAINPRAAAVLIPGGLPTSRLPVIIAMLTLMLMMAAAAELVRRRESRLARLREDFVSSVSHELRTPLTQIRMLSELLATDGFKSDEERLRAIGIVHRESMRLTSLVENVLEFSRLKRANAKRAQARVAVADVLRAVVDDLAPLIEAQRHRIELTAEPDIHVQGDRDAIGRIVRNLVDNAAKYGRAAQTIRIALQNGDGRARITVDDEGPGVPVDERERIWQPYYRLGRDVNAPGGGSGLGLSVVADLARSLGGTASVVDAPSGGARFIVDLPRVS